MKLSSVNFWTNRRLHLSNQALAELIGAFPPIRKIRNLKKITKNVFNEVSLIFYLIQF